MLVRTTTGAYFASSGLENSHDYLHSGGSSSSSSTLGRKVGTSFLPKFFGFGDSSSSASGSSADEKSSSSTPTAPVRLEDGTLALDEVKRTRTWLKKQLQLVSAPSESLAAKRRDQVIGLKLVLDDKMRGNLDNLEAALERVSKSVNTIANKLREVNQITGRGGHEVASVEDSGGTDGGGIEEQTEKALKQFL
ncbi:unnamed protein product [Amoebophrya sp. A25]|nr:unnamed protein product [Amoebophrya sp. A25]|eukprot:GSA25T00006800001.1